MKTSAMILCALLALMTVGCSSTSQAPTPAPTAVSAPSPTTAAVTAAYPQGSIKKGGQGVCVVCFTKEGTSVQETVAETIDYKGKTYVFCNEAEKAEFISEPGRFTKP